jgi:hypothetical protein
MGRSKRRNRAKEQTARTTYSPPKGTPADLFVSLTSWIGPESEDDAVARVIEDLIGQALDQDAHGNYHLTIPGGNESVVFAAHLDTVEFRKVAPARSITHSMKGSHGACMMTDGKTILGADDRTGCAILTYMILQGVPGNYVFFTSEEVGCVGSRALAGTGWGKDYRMMIEFDRKGYTDIITAQSTGTTASNEFAKALATALNGNDATFGFKPSPNGVYTDSAYFSDEIAECTNVSVGYFDQHTNREYQDMAFLDKLCKALVAIGTGFEALPTPRIPGTGKHTYGRTHYADFGDYGGFGSYYRHGDSRTTRHRSQEDVSKSILSDKLARIGAKRTRGFTAMFEDVQNLSRAEVKLLKEALYDMVDQDIEGMLVSLLSDSNSLLRYYLTSGDDVAQQWDMFHDPAPLPLPDDDSDADLESRVFLDGDLDDEPFLARDRADVYECPDCGEPLRLSHFEEGDAVQECVGCNIYLTEIELGQATA